MDFHYSVTTGKDVAKAVASLEETLKAKGFGVLWQLDVPAKLQEKGLDYQTPYRILEVCNPREAKIVLTQNPLAGYFLPCKIVVFESEGQTRIGLPKPTVLIDIVGDPALADVAKRVEADLKEAIKGAA